MTSITWVMSTTRMTSNNGSVPSLSCLCRQSIYPCHTFWSKTLTSNESLPPHQNITKATITAPTTTANNPQTTNPNHNRNRILPPWWNIRLGTFLHHQRCLCRWSIYPCCTFYSTTEDFGGCSRCGIESWFGGIGAAISSSTTEDGGDDSGLEETVALSTLWFDSIEEEDNLVVIISPAQDNNDGLRKMNKLLSDDGVRNLVLLLIWVHMVMVMVMVYY